MIVAHVMFDVTSGKRDLFIATALVVMKNSKSEEGCILYNFTSDLETENRFYLAEIWTGQATLDAHLAQPHARSSMEILSEISTISVVNLYQGELVAMPLPN